jgi:DNA-binding phage protein
MYKVNAQALRARCGSASQMAKKVDLTDAAIFKLLSGERRPSYNMISRFKKAYGFTPEEVDEFFFYEDQTEEPAASA